MRCSLPKSGRSFAVTADESVLHAALGAGLNLPHSCKGGNCGSCRARLLEGEIAYPHGRPLGLSDAEIADGFVLLCQARALTDLAIDTFEILPADEAVTKRLPCRIERALPLSHDVVALFLRLPAAEEFKFLPGQYLDIMLPGGRRRSFSIASPPHDASLLELHVRRVAGGEFTDRLFAGELQNRLLNIEGPLGQFVYRPAAGTAPGGAAPLLLIGGGTGLAPLLCIIRHVIENSLGRDMTLYWGVRAERDFYAEATLAALARRCPQFKAIPVLSEPSDAWRGRRGWVHEAALFDIPSPQGYEVYASGPPAMIAAVRRDFSGRGVPAAQIFFDSFDYAPDTLARQRSSAASKS